MLNLLDQAMLALSDANNPTDAWKQFVKPGQVVGLKVNCLAGRGMSTSTVLVEALVERLREAGINQQDIVIWDRLNRDLERAGFRLSERGSQLRCFGNDSSGFEQELLTYGQVGSLVSRTLTRLCDVVINLPILKDHGITGMTGALKNLFGAIHNPNKYHLDVGDPYVPDVWMLEPIRAKVQLNICEATTVQYHGGPSFMPDWTWNLDGLLLSRDPVALDTIGWQLIDRKRRQEGMKLLEDEGRKPSYIATAADREHRLGFSNPDQIQLVELDA
jgi:uncharacterized protein (DUF362 family)